MIFFNNFQQQHKAYAHLLHQAATRVIDSGWYILGKELELFEQKLAKYLDVKHVIGVASGTDSITLALMAADIGDDDEVITTSVTAYPTICGIERAGAKPIIIDISPDNGLMDLDAVESRINTKTKAIIPVHLYGQSVDMGRLKKLCQKYNLRLIEDAAQSIGATYKNRKLGSIGDMGALSFYPTKNLGALGDAGAIATNSDKWAEILKQIRNYGQTNRYQHIHKGLNSRLDEMQAAILALKLDYLEEENHKRRKIANFYTQNLQYVEPLAVSEYAQHNFHLYVIKAPKRDDLMTFLKQKGIQTLIHYPVPVHKQPAFQGKKENLPVSEKFVKEILSLPIYPQLSQHDQEYIVNMITKFYTQ